MILVTGASGTIGRELLKELATTGVPVRAAYRSRPPAVQPGQESAPVDLSTGAGLSDALRGASALFLLTGEIPDQTNAELRVVEAAVRAGVRRIVKLSVLNCDTGNFYFAKIHRPVERAIEQSGVPYTLLRPNGFMQNFYTYEGAAIRAHGAFYLSCGDARVSVVDARDIAAVAARTLTSDAHAGKAFNLTGPEALTHGEIAAKISAAIGRPIQYVALSDTDYKKGMVQAGVPAEFADVMVDLCAYYRTGAGARVDNAIQTVTGRPATPFDAFARDHAKEWYPK